MSKKQEKTLEKVSDDQAPASVYDFLYYDVERIASFLSQLDVYGHLQQITFDESARNNELSNVAEHGTLNAGFIKGGLNSNQTNSSEKSESLKSVYDPRWANALNFLDLAKEQNLINTDITSSGLGQLVLFSGSLGIFDSSLISSMWSSPLLKKKLASSTTTEANRAERRKNKNNSNDLNLAEAGIEILTVIPNTIQLTIKNTNNISWSTIVEKNLTISALDLLLKHGLLISGEWHIIGILDAKPTYLSKNTEQTDISLLFGAYGSEMGSALTEMIRTIVGKPDQAYGITPLLIFRKIEAN